MATLDQTDETPDAPQPEAHAANHPFATTTPAPRQVLTRQRLRAEAAKPRTERVYIDEWQCDAIIRVMTGIQRDAYEAEITGTRVPGKNQPRSLNLANIRARLVARCLIDDQGEPLYDWRNPSDLDELGKTDAAILDKIFTAASQLNGITERDIEELAKNLPAGANGVSGSN